jgi:hypothetical protein
MLDHGQAGPAAHKVAIARLHARRLGVSSVIA